MDAKPQRPIRSLRVRGDENVPPATQNAKTIHQRNKSSPALSTMLGGGGIKAAAKRTAFGDVSNTVNVARPSKDDTALATKPVLQPGARSGHVQEKRSAALLRPAQRPLSVSNLKGLLNSVASVVTADSTTRSANGEAGPTNQAANIRKVLTKRNTTIFKDPALEVVAEVASQSLTHAKTTTSTVPSAQPLLQPIPQLEAFGEHVPVIRDSLKDLQPLPSKRNMTETTEAIVDAPPVSSEAEKGDAVSSDQVYVDAKRDLRAYQEELPSLQEPHQAIVKVAESRVIAPNKLETYAMPIPNCAAPILPVQPVVAQQPHPLPSEPEEYWDDDEEDENYDEEGYVTARSFRSRGENTTGGGTTVLFPHVNQKVKREIAAAKKFVEATRTPEEIEDESYDTSMVAEYGEEIFDYMKQLEVKMLPNAHYMENQHEIQWSMRAVLMDWLVQVHHRFNLLPETLFLCVNYIDRFLSCKVVSLGKLQLVGATAIFIAAKYEEINCPSVQEIVYMVDGGYTIDEILKAERFMLTMLQFELGWPGPMSFLRRVSKADDYDLETRTLAKYFLEVTIMDERFIGSPPSFTAAGSHCLARLMLHKGQWTPQHVYYSNYTFPQLLPLITLILECCDDPRKHHAAVYNKYVDKRYKRASAFVETEIQRGFQLPGLSVPKEVVVPKLVSYFDHSSYFRI